MGILLIHQPASAIDSTYVAFKPGPDRFELAAGGQAAPLFISSEDYQGVIRALGDLQGDINKVTGVKPELIQKDDPEGNRAVLVGTVGKSPLISRLVDNGKLDVSGIQGKWESYLLQVVQNPVPGVEQALVIAGSDKRGTIYGIYDLSREIGVSPWYWWADVPVPKQQSVFVKNGRYVEDSPKVKYRGIFINDEAPALTGWVHENYGKFNHEFYEHVFELILRLKGNYLWPAMWGRSLFDDDSLSQGIADRYGVVLGTSHHEPMMRANVEWDRYGSGPWNYQNNAQNLREYWKKGIERMNDYESIVTIGMRGHGDKPMSDQRNIKLLERIVHDQRQIIEDVTGKDASKTPQIWALYKEVQQYYDMGMEVPDDVTLLFSDDNWGHIRRLPELKDSTRPGGYGIYYHFDYVGGPRSYRWINTNPLPKIWQQMHMAYKYKARRIWIVNVGDLKPMEFPITFFLDYAWNPDRYPAENLPAYVENWASDQFGPEYADAIADILTKYTKYNGRRKPELLSDSTYSLVHYREAEKVREDYDKLTDQAEDIYNKMPDAYKAAYYQLVLYPVKASANLYDMYVSQAQNRLYAEQGRAASNEMAARVREYFEQDSLLAHYYNTEMAGGKWNHMMDQSNIGYTSWDDPDHDIMPTVDSIQVPEPAELGVAVQGSRSWWPKSKKQAELPPFSKYDQQRRYFEIFNRGRQSFDFRAQTDQSWLQLSETQGRIDQQKRLWVEVDWDKVPTGSPNGTITITGPDNKEVNIKVIVNNPAVPAKDDLDGFIETDGYLSIEAPHYTKAVSSSKIQWKNIPNFGRTLSGMMPVPVTASPVEPGNDSPHLEYNIYLDEAGSFTVRAHMFPSLDVHDTGGLRFAVSVDGREPQIINMDIAGSYQKWARAVSNAIAVRSAKLSVDKPGEHTLKFWMVDPGLVLEKLVIDTGGLRPSYLGPPESYWNRKGADK